MTGEAGSEGGYAAGSEEGGRGPGTKECGCPLKAGRGRKQILP